MFRRRQGQSRQARLSAVRDPSTWLHAGFTLVELLITIAIIALLMAILLPSLRRARWQAQKAVCQSNLHQISVAWHMYLQDNDDAFYQEPNANWNYGGRQGIAAAYRQDKPLNPYFTLPLKTDDAAAFRCPSDQGSKYIATPSYYLHYGTSYNTNEILIGENHLIAVPTYCCEDLIKNLNVRIESGVKFSRIGNTSELILLGDAGWKHRWWPFSVRAFNWHRKPSWHNVAYLDGHASFVNIQKGKHVTRDYSVIPFVDLRDEAEECQAREDCFGGYE